MTVAESCLQYCHEAMLTYSSGDRPKSSLGFSDELNLRSGNKQVGNGRTCHLNKLRCCIKPSWKMALSLKTIWRWVWSITRSGLAM